MKIWIYLNGMQQGPYDYSQLQQMPIDANTPVWYEGLADWTAAGVAPATAPLFAMQPGQSGWQAQQLGWQQQGWQQQPGWQAQQPDAAYQQQAKWAMPPARPSTYLVWSILLTLLCCTPLSIAAIVTGAITNSRYNSGDYAGAERMSHTTEWLVILSILFGVLAIPLSLIFLL